VAFSDTGAIEGVSGTPKPKVLSYTGVAYLLFVGLSFVARDSEGFESLGLLYIRALLTVDQINHH
jgi:hypothetical protein